MWLVNTTTRTLEPAPFYEPNIPSYAILSHTWGGEEITFHDINNPKKLNLKKGWLKLIAACEQALLDGLNYIWVDTCCIDKSSSAELSEAINSMFCWYRQAAKCYVYLFDFRHGSSLAEMLVTCRWFKRGWTLQELIAPQEVQFYDQNWVSIGSREELCALVSEITSIPMDAILGTRPLTYYSISQKLSWASSRVTTRVEDTAYCLLGIFDVHMPLLYGEGQRAFFRLQEEIIKNTLDMTLLAWEPRADDFEESFCGIIARSPSSFKDGGSIRRFRREARICTIDARGLRFNHRPPARLFSESQNYYIEIGKTGKPPHQSIVYVAVTMVGPGVYARNGQVPLVLHPNQGEHDAPGVYKPRHYTTVHFAVKLYQAYHRVKSSIRFNPHPAFSVVNVFPRRLWDEMSHLLYYSQTNTFRLFELRGELAGHLIEPVLLIHYNKDPRCILFDRKYYFAQTEKIIRHIESEYIEFRESEVSELLGLSDKVFFDKGGTTFVIEAAVTSTMQEFGLQKKKNMWDLSITVSEGLTYSKSELTRPGSFPLHLRG